MKQCLECDNEIKGRIDKKFCSDYCRNAYNNKLNKDSNNLVRNTNNRLRKNYRILDAYELKDGKTRTTKNSLLNKGECLQVCYRLTNALQLHLKTHLIFRQITSQNTVSNLIDD